MNREELTRADLRELIDMKDAEAGAYLSLLAPLLQRLGGETVITLAEAEDVPEGVVVCMEPAGTDVRVWLGLPEGG